MWLFSEWSKHGTCTGMTQDEYFTKGLDLFKTYGNKCSSSGGSCKVCLDPDFSFERTC